MDKLSDIDRLLAVESEKVSSHGWGQPVLANFSLQFCQVSPAEVVVEEFVFQGLVHRVALSRLDHQQMLP